MKIRSENEMKIKILTPVRMAIVKAPQAVSCGEGVDKSELTSTEVEDGTWQEP